MGAAGCPELAQGSASCDRKRLLNSPGHSALPPNLSQSFSREVGPFTRRSCRLLELTFCLLARACITSGVFELRTLPQSWCGSGSAAQCASARPRGSRSPEEGADRARCLGRSGARGARSTHSAFRGWWRLLAHPSDRTPQAVGSQAHGSPTRRRPHCGSSLWSLEVFFFFCRYVQLSGARSLPQSWPRALFRADPNHTQWQMGFFLTGFLTCRVHFKSVLNMMSSLSSRQSISRWLW